MSQTRRSLAELEQTTDFIGRHIGPGESDIGTMLSELGLPSLDALVAKTVPAAIRAKGPPRVSAARSERAALERLRSFARRNKVFRSMIGMGYHDCITPPVILRNVLENPGWYTAYTPYQPEISQGRLEALLAFQTMVSDLTGMEIANASLLDESTAAAEAMVMCRSVGGSASRTYFVAETCHPQTIAVVRTRAEPLGLDVVVGDPRRDLGGCQPFGVLLQYPDGQGEVHDLRPTIDEAHAKGALVTVVADLLALALLTPPGEQGADVVVGSTQRLGVPLGFGGPHAAYFATRDKLKRALPGRLVGVSVDRDGRPALRLSLQTREQHIRREKATSNICTAQVLLAVVAAMYAVYHGPAGLRTIAERVHRLSAILKAGLERLGFAVANRAFFDTLTVAAPGQAAAIHARARAGGINLREAGADSIGISLDETTTRGDVEALLSSFAGAPAPELSVEELDRALPDGIPESLRRRSAYLTHPIFNSHHSETEMLRFLKRLEDKDVALNRAMIPLGSCTMKLNATTEMMPVTWPEFSGLHPFAPLDQARGYMALIKELERMLLAVSGFDAVSLQPNSGAQGEYAGLLVIRAYHRSRGEGHRRICLIPSSAHGTNPASAAMAGFEVVVVACDKAGNVDVADLEAKAAEHARDLAALMITYPSTHGVFEEAIVEICRIVHRAGGQVYMDGANLNALVGVARPGAFGPDVMHINLHKTFCIPHGGGGPGMGPICVKRHLAPFLPGHPVRPEAGPPTGIGPVSAAPWGSAGILVISWAYIAMMGGEGLKRATEVAILNANYIAKRLGPHFPVLYTGANGMVAHECIIDLRPLKDSSGVTVDDVAKRLVDYGFHAPTMSFPVAGTFMIEPTESEPKVELDRFCEAMIGIRGEIRRIEEGAISRTDNPLKNAPHTAADLAAAEWTHPYSREEALFPVAAQKGAKYWPPVSRIDQVYGDRNLVCACPPVESYQRAAE
ncbi:MAG: aminomethyl-transferring glycine dehydrogenase [Alphaproteobacteria bacterium]